MDVCEASKIEKNKNLSVVGVGKGVFLLVFLELVIFLAVLRTCYGIRLLLLLLLRTILVAVGILAFLRDAKFRLF